MRKSIIFITILSAFVLSSCGVGNYSVSGGMADQAALSVSSTQRKMQVVVAIDGQNYTVDAVYHKAFKSSKDIKKTAANTIYLAPGQHQVKIYNAQDVNTPIFSKTIVVSVGDHRIIEL